MLNAEENALLTQVGPGTLMGSFLRRYWAPALLSDELAEPDGAPVEVTLLGEELVAFRDSAGKPGLLSRYCPHRRASLAYGRNEEGGLRCVYHGWKFDVGGVCLDMPTEPADSPFQRKLRARSYPVHEAGGIVWAYLGPPDEQPPFPDFDWVRCWPHRSKEWKILEECNYAQAIEGGIDSAHVGFLHRRASDAGQNLNSKYTAPRLQVQYTSYGFRYAAIRDTAEKNQYVRVTPYIVPWTTVVPPGNVGFARSGPRTVNIWVPRDDVSTWHYQYLYDLDGEIDIEQRIQDAGLWLDENYRKLRNADNRYLQDREEMRSGENYSGVLGIVTEDHLVNESQGAIIDRSQEHLGISDIAVLAMRRLLLKAARGLRDGNADSGLERAGDVRGITSQADLIDAGVVWQDYFPISDELVRARAAADSA